MRVTREKEIRGLMDQRRHLAETQQVRQERKIGQYLASSKQNLFSYDVDIAKKKGDPFYLAAMKSRQKRQQALSKETPLRHIYGKSARR